MERLETQLPLTGSREAACLTLLDDLRQEHGDAALAALGVRPGRSTRDILHTLYERYLIERTNGRRPDFLSENTRVRDEFVAQLRGQIGVAIRQVLDDLRSYPIAPSSRKVRNCGAHPRGSNKTQRNRQITRGRRR